MTDQEETRKELISKLHGAIKGEGAEKEVDQATKKTDKEFSLAFLLSMGHVTKTIKEGKIQASFQSVDTESMFDIDNETDAITLGAVSNNVRKSLRYCCAALRGYSIEGQYVDLTGNNWKENEKHLMTLSNFFVNKLLKLHSMFEREAASLFDADAVKK